MCYAQALRSETSYCYLYCCSSECVCTTALNAECVSGTVLCSALYTACVDASRTVFWDRSMLYFNTSQKITSIQASKLLHPGKVDPVQPSKS